MAEGKAADGYQPYQYDDPSASLWSAYLSKSEKYDRTMAQNWKGDMDSILIFAGLFSASVTAFIVESYKTLNANPSDATVLLLAQISQQLGLLSSNVSSTTTNLPLLLLNQDSFSPPTSALICNILWFLSLGFSLICALSATLVEQWTRQYLQTSHSKPTPQDRARISAYLYQGVEKYRMEAIVKTIPLLLHISLFLFFAGLVAFLIPVNIGIEFLILAMLLVCCLLYFFITVLPIFCLSSPYWTPLSTFSWSVLRKLGLLRRRDADGNDVPICCSMNEARELEAMEITPERDQRDLKAMCWTLNSLREDNEFEPFVEVIPSVVSGFDYSAKWLLDTLLHHDDISIKLGYRVPQLLLSCTSGLLGPSIAHKRAITCLKAIWSLTMLSMPKPATSQPTFRESLKFREDTFELLFNVQRAIPSPEVLDHISSASTVVARSLLDMQVDRACALEAELLAALETGKPVLVRKGSIDEANIPFYDTRDVLDASKHRIQLLGEQVLNSTKLTTPLPHVTIEAIALHLARAASLAANSAFGLDRKAASEVLDCVRSLQKALNQAGFNLALEYVANMLESDTIPHEAQNTIRRTFFRINVNFEKKARKEFTKESQERLVTYLEEAAEYTTSGCTRLPRNILSILFSLTRALSDPTLVLKAISIIENYKKASSDEAVPGILATLERALPRDNPVSLPLDLFSSHLYTHAKPMRKQMKSRTNTLSSTSESTIS